MIPVFTCCPCCGTRHEWSWEEAFDKFGFGDGDSIIMTGSVAETLRANGCTVAMQRRGDHNLIITRIERGGVSLIPADTDLGYDDPRDYLPHSIVSLLDSEFPEHTEVRP